MAHKRYPSKSQIQWSKWHLPMSRKLGDRYLRRYRQCKMKTSKYPSKDSLAVTMWLIKNCFFSRKNPWMNHKLLEDWQFDWLSKSVVITLSHPQKQINFPNHFYASTKFSDKIVILIKKTPAMWYSHTQHTLSIFLYL